MPGVRPTVGSLFSGIGGLDLGLERADFEVRWQVEIDPFCRKVLDKHWPAVKKYGDIREVNPDELEPVDLICGGFPCQDISIGGRRKGLLGERSSLFFEYKRVVAALRPRWVLIENVPGLLSSGGGRDMGTILGALGELGYGWAYRVLNAAYFGVSQDRPRLFIAGSLGDRSAAKVLFESEWCEGSLEEESGSLTTPEALRRPCEASKWDTRTDFCWSLTRPGDFRNFGYLAPTVVARWGTGGGNVPLVGLRYLSTTECARLQGFPDNHCRLDDKTPDSPQYKAFGNAVCVNVAEWIGTRIKEAMSCQA